MQACVLQLMDVLSMQLPPFQLDELAVCNGPDLCQQYSASGWSCMQIFACFFVHTGVHKTLTIPAKPLPER